MVILRYRFHLFCLSFKWRKWKLTTTTTLSHISTCLIRPMIVYFCLYLPSKLSFKLKLVFLLQINWNILDLQPNGENVILFTLTKWQKWNSFEQKRISPIHMNERNKKSANFENEMETSNSAHRKCAQRVGFSYIIGKMLSMYL